MALRIPKPQVLDEMPAGRVRAVVSRIAFRRWTEQLLPAATALELIGVLNNVPGSVTEDGHAFGHGGPLPADVFFLLQLQKPRVGPIEREGDARRAVRAEP